MRTVGAVGVFALLLAVIGGAFAATRAVVLPRAVDDRARTNDDVILKIAVLANDVGQHLRVASVDTRALRGSHGRVLVPATVGRVAVGRDGVVSYDPRGRFEFLRAGQSAVDVFRYRVTDGSRTSAPATVRVRVFEDADRPVAVPDSASTDAAHSVVIWVLRNDRDPDGRRLRVAGTDVHGLRGTVRVGGDGSITYDPSGRFGSLAAGAVAHDSFRYKVSNGRSESNFARVTVTIRGVGAPGGSVPVLDGVEQQAVGYTSGDPPVVVSSSIRVSGAGSLVRAVVWISSGFDVAGDLLSFTGGGGIAGSFDRLTGTLTLTGSLSVASYQAALRSVMFSADAQTPSGSRAISFQVFAAGGSGAGDGFAFAAADQGSNVVSRAVTVTNSSGGGGGGGGSGIPVAVNDSYTVAQDGTLSPDAAHGVLANDTQADGAALSAVKVSDPSHGSLTLNSDGSFTYTPNAGYHGTDSFTYKANNGFFDSGPATVTITVDAPPVAVNDSYTAPQSGTLSPDAAHGVLANDSQADGKSLSAVKVSDPSHGSLTLNSDGSFTYTPTAGYHGPDSFTYKANDGFQDSNTATVTITVDAVPVAVNDSYTVAQNGALSPDAAHGVLAKDTQADGNPLTAVKVSDPAHGSLTLNSDGSFTYTPTAGYHGPDSFTYKANDGFQDSNTATVTITVDAVPVAVNDSYTVAQNGTLTPDAAHGVLANDTQADGAALSAVKVSDPSHGSLTLNSDGSFTYTPTAGYHGPDSFTYKANDGFQDSNTATVTITVDDAPVAVDDSYAVAPGRDADAGRGSRGARERHAGRWEPVDRGEGERSVARDVDAQLGRVVHVYADGGLSRPGFVHLQGQRRLPGLQHGDRHDHRRRRAGRGQRQLHRRAERDADPGRGARRAGERHAGRRRSA